MEENFNVVAQSRANYYTPGSPVQFVRIEILKGDQSNENAVCLTFKNIAAALLTQLDITFKCKNHAGDILCEQSFQYKDLTVKTGESFGADDAVFVSDEDICSADVLMNKVYSGKKAMLLKELPHQKLPAQELLEPEVAAALIARIGREDLNYMPTLMESGWQCACGAFHPKEENTVYCSECGSDRILLKSALSVILNPQAVAPTPEQSNPTVVAMADETRVMPATGNPSYTAPPVAEDHTQVVSNVAEDATVRMSVDAESNINQFATQYHTDVRAREALAKDDEYVDPRDELAINLMRWVPVGTAILCAIIAIGGFLYCQFGI